MSRGQWILLVFVCVFAGSAGVLVSRWSDSQRIDEATAAPTSRQDTSPSSASVLNQPMPEVSLQSLDGGLVQNDQWKGQVLVVNFWATWCAPCLEEIPILIDLQRVYADRAVTFVGIALDNPERIREFMERIKINYPVLLGGADAIALGQAFGNELGVLPFSAFVDREGKIIHTHFGVLTREQIVPIIDSVL